MITKSISELRNILPVKFARNIDYDSSLKNENFSSLKYNLGLKDNINLMYDFLNKKIKNRVRIEIKEVITIKQKSYVRRNCHVVSISSSLEETIKLEKNKIIEILEDKINKLKERKITKILSSSKGSLLKKILLLSKQNKKLSFIMSEIEKFKVGNIEDYVNIDVCLLKEDMKVIVPDELEKIIKKGLSFYSINNDSVVKYKGEIRDFDLYNGSLNIELSNHGNLLDYYYNFNTERYTITGEKIIFSKKQDAFNHLKNKLEDDLINTERKIEKLLLEESEE